MECLLDFVLTLSQSSQLLQSRNLAKLSEKLRNQDCSIETMKEIVVLIGKSLMDAEAVDKILFEPINDITKLCFEKSFTSCESSCDSLLRVVLDSIFETMSRKSQAGTCFLLMDSLSSMLNVAEDPTFDLVGRFDVLTCLNVVLSSLNAEARCQIWESDCLRKRISLFGTKLVDLGDFDLQAHAAALLLRLVPFKYQRHFAATHIVPGNLSLINEFCQLGGTSFESKIRSFLNKINRLNMENPKVVSLPCSSVSLCSVELRIPPTHEANPMFWLDFNFVSERITVYCLPLNEESETQYSGSAPMQHPWEILCIYPEMIDVLDMDVSQHAVSLKFTMAESICNFCEWAPNISGNNINMKININETDQSFKLLRFSEEPPKDSAKFGLVRILQQIENLIKEATVKQHLVNDAGLETPREWQLHSLKPHSANSTCMAISPVAIGQLNAFPSQELSSCNDLVSGISFPTEKQLKAIASSPLQCVSVHAQSAQPPTPVTVSSLSSHSSVASNSTSIKTLGIDESHDYSHPEQCSFEHALQSNSDEFINTKTKEILSPEKSPRPNVSCSPRIVLGSSNAEDYSPPEKQREAVCDLPGIPLIVNSPLVKIAEELALHSPDTALSLHSIPTSPAPSTPRKAKAENDFNKSSDTSLLLESPGVRLLDCSVPLDRCPSVIPSPQSVKQPNTPCVQSIQNEPVDENVILSPAVNEASSSSTAANSFLLSSSSDVTPSCLWAGTSNLRTNETAVRKLCDISTSYLVDASPANCNHPLTPERYTIISLPDISTSVHFAKKSKVKSKRNYKKSHTSIADVVPEEPPMKAYRPASPHESPPRSDSSDPDYLPPTISSPEGPERNERRRSLRARPVQSTDQTNKSQDTDLTPIVDKPSQLSRTTTPPDDEQTPSSVLVKPVSSLKKRRFFSTVRSDRLDREKKRFEEACGVRGRDKVKCGGKKSAIKYSKSKKEKIPKSQQHAASTVTTTVQRPTVTDAIAIASASNAMPIDSDSEFLPDIIDADAPTFKNEVPFAAASNALETLVEEQFGNEVQSQDYIPASWDSHQDFDRTSAQLNNGKTCIPLESESDYSFDNDQLNSTQPSLFAPTPPPASKINPIFRKGRSESVVKPVPLKFKQCSEFPSKKVEFDQHVNPVTRILSQSIERNVDLDISVEECSIAAHDAGKFATFELENYRDVSDAEPKFQIKKEKSTKFDCAAEFKAFIHRIGLIGGQVYKDLISHRKLGWRLVRIQKELTFLKGKAKQLQHMCIPSEIYAQ